MRTLHSIPREQKRIFGLDDFKYEITGTFDRVNENMLRMQREFERVQQAYTLRLLDLENARRQIQQRPAQWDGWDETVR